MYIYIYMCTELKVAGTFRLRFLVSFLLLGGLCLPCGRFELKSLNAGGRRVGDLVALAV